MVRPALNLVAESLSPPRLRMRGDRAGAWLPPGRSTEPWNNDGVACVTKEIPLFT